MSGVALSGVSARDAAGVKGTPRGIVFGASLALQSGIAVFVGSPEDGTLALAEALIGRRKIDRGSLTVDGRDPFLDPDLRARIGYVALEPAIPPAATVAGSVEIAVAAWASPPAAQAVLDRAGLASLASRRLHDTSRAERRAIEWALAISLPTPLLTVIFEPFTDLGPVARESVEKEIARLASSSPVVVLTSSPRDARHFDHVAILHRGAVVRDSRAPHGALGTGALTALTARITGGARALGAALLAHEAVTSVAFDHEPGRQNEPDRSTLRISGTDREALALALADAVVSTGATLVSLNESAPGLAEVRAQTELEQRRIYLETERGRMLEARAAAERAALAQGWPGAAPPLQQQQVPYGAVGHLAVPQPGAPNFMENAPAPAPAPVDPKKDGEPS
jgi:ABC-type multidrug transport system ATPase subunit